MEEPRHLWLGQSVPATTGVSRCGAVAAAAAAPSPPTSPGAGVIYYSFAAAPLCSSPPSPPLSGSCCQQERGSEARGEPAVTELGGGASSFPSPAVRSFFVGGGAKACSFLSSSPPSLSLPMFQFFSLRMFWFLPAIVYQAVAAGRALIFLRPPPPPRSSLLLPSY